MEAIIGELISINVLLAVVALSSIFVLVIFYLQNLETVKFEKTLMEGLISATHTPIPLTDEGTGKDFIDTDAILSSPEMVETISTAYAEEIAWAKKVYDIHVLAFLEKDSGLIGVLTLKDLLIVKTGLPALIVRGRKRLQMFSLKGPEMRLKPKSRALVISDVATTGTQIKNAASALLAHHDIEVVCAIVLVDREDQERPAKTELANWKEVSDKGIKLVAIKTLSQIKAAKTNPITKGR